MKKKIEMDDLCENYSLMLHKDGAEPNVITLVNIRDFLEMLEVEE